MMLRITLDNNDLSVAEHIAKKMHKSLEEYLGERALMSLPADLADLYSPTSKTYQRLMQKIGCGAKNNKAGPGVAKMVPIVVAAQNRRSKGF